MSYDAAPRASTSSSSSDTSLSSHGRRSPVSWGLPTALATEEKPTSRRRITKQPRAAATSSPLHFLYPGLTNTHTSAASTPSHAHTPLFGQPTALTTPSASSTKRASRHEAKAAAAAARRSSDLARLLDPAYLPAAARRQLETAQYAGQQGVYVDDDGEMHDPDWKHFPVLPPGMGVNSESKRGRGGAGMVKDGRQSSTGSASGYARSGAYGSSLYGNARRGTSPTARGQRRPRFDWELAVDEEALADEYPEDAVLEEELNTRLREEQRAKERREKEAKEREERRRSLGDVPGSPGGRREDDRGYGGSGRRSWEDPGPMRVPSPMNDVLLLGPPQPRRAVSAAAPKAPVPNTIAYQQPGLGRHPVSKVTSSRGVSRGNISGSGTRDGSFSTFATAATGTTTAPTSWESADLVRDSDAPVVGGVYILGGEKEKEEKDEKKDGGEKECVTTRIAKKARRFSWGSPRKDEKPTNWSPQSPATPLSPTSPTSPLSAFSHSSAYSFSHSPSPYIDEEDENERDAEEEQEQARPAQTAFAPSCGQSLRRQWHAFALSVRFGVFRAQRRVMRRVHSIL
ncbi:hypothetical protein D9619_005200 [Psilocybe cf. subviscida]|uniref:Uncharacterized protein n=1 Tax=Psilocybe cf. subviscida TaxID=2480587 RepID=A0A8H5FBZ2_9AGAR|nr:hypothetical protein D9619_005200 [Psilocybe cf. subviscida]